MSIFLGAAFILLCAAGVLGMLFDTRRVPPQSEEPMWACMRPGCKTVLPIGHRIVCRNGPCPMELM